MDIDDILRQCNKDNPNFYIEAVVADDILNSEQGILGVLTQKDLDDISDIVQNEIDCGPYTKEQLEEDITKIGAYLLVVRLRNDLNGHKAGEIVGTAIVYNDCTHVAQERNYFINKKLTEAHLGLIAVNKDVRDRNNPNCIRGIGSTLMHCVNKMAQMERYKYLTLLSVNTEEAYSFYQHKGMLKAERFFTRHYTKVLSPHAEASARVIVDIMDYMKRHRLRKYSHFVGMYSAIHGQNMSALIGKHADKEQEKFAKMLMDTNPNSMQYSTVANVRRVLNEMYDGTSNNPELREYLEFMHMNTKDKKGCYYDSHRGNDRNTYFQKHGRTSVVGQMSENQQNYMMYLINTAKLIKEDKQSINI